MADFVWHGRTLRSIRELLDAAQEVRTRKEARAFLNAYEAVTPHARENLGYALGYLGPQKRKRLYALFAECNHPVFGHGFGRGNDPTQREAFLAGVALGRKKRRERP